MVLLFLLVPRTTFAQSAQVQPIMGFAWPSHSIPVSIAASQSAGRQAVLNAMGTWNLAQLWFITSYMAGQGEPFVLYETNVTLDSLITVSFNQTQTTPYLGWTNSHEYHDLQGDFKKVTVSITIDLTNEDGENLTLVELQRLATHELGHALGLDHETFSADDLMWPIPKVMFPSTLNLYTVYLLTESANIKNLPQQSVSLPGNIPYLVASQADLNGVIPPVAETINQATTVIMPQTEYEIAYSPWLWITILVILTSAIVASITRRREVWTQTKDAPIQRQVILPQKFAVVDQPARPKNVKICRYCGVEVLQQHFICPKCGMPAGYL
jgi:hypothetical protein